LNETPTTFDPGDRVLSMSPTVNPLKYAGDAVRPVPPRTRTVGSATTFTFVRSVRSYQEFPTMPELRGERPESSTECPGPVSVQAWR
jgi:hypothetical protein